MALKPRLERTDRKSLLLGTALASTLLLGMLMAPAPAQAQVDCLTNNPAPPGNIFVNENDDIVCDNDGDRDFAGTVIELIAYGGNHQIELENSYYLTAVNNAGYATAIRTAIYDGYSQINIVNSGDALVESTDDYGFAVGIDTYSYGVDNYTRVENSGDFVINSTATNLQTSNAYAYGIRSEGIADNNDIRIENSGDFTITGTGAGSYGTARVYGISALVTHSQSAIHIINTGDFVLTGLHTLEGNSDVTGIRASAEQQSGENPININNSGDFTLEAEGRYGAEARGIDSYVFFSDSPININNSGDFTISALASDPYSAAQATGIRANTGIGDDSPIEIVNSGDFAITATAGNFARVLGIDALTANDPNSPININNSGDFTVEAQANYSFATAIQARVYSSSVEMQSSGDLIVTAGTEAFGIFGYAFYGYQGGNFDIRNSGDILVTTGNANYGRAGGISAFARDYGSVDINNSGEIFAAAGDGNLVGAFGIYARGGVGSPIGIVNTGDVTAIVGNGEEAYAVGIRAMSLDVGSPIDILSSGDITAIAISDEKYSLAMGIDVLAFGSNAGIFNDGDIVAGVGNGNNSRAYGIRARTVGAPIDIVNTGDMVVGTGNGDFSGAVGIYAYTEEPNAPASVTNTGNIDVTSGTGDASNSRGIAVRTDGLENHIEIVNSGNVAAASAGVGTAFAAAIHSVGSGYRTSIEIVNSGDLTATSTGFSAAIDATTTQAYSPISITTSGKLTATSPYSYGIIARTAGASSDIVIVNSGSIDPAIGIRASTFGPNSSIVIENSGSVFGDDAGIYAFSVEGTHTIINSGDISAANFHAINILLGSTTILNDGLITGYITLTDQPDTFLNEAGGVFETKLTSDFGRGGDLFRNEGTVLAATNPNVREFSSFINLVRFESQGLITMVDGREGDVFEISNTVGGEDLAFAASGNSTLAVDAFLGGPGSEADNLVINGNVTGQTLLRVNNTSSGGGAANAVIPVVYVGGNVRSDAFFLPQPIDAGFFQYDLFFRPTGSGIFELRSVTGPGAVILPQLITGTQDIWHQGSSTWFDRSADLRVLLAGGASPLAYDPHARYADGAAAGPASFTPAVWARGSGGWLDREATEKTIAHGNTYRFNLDRDLEIIDWQMGLDLGKRDFLSQGDILVFGVLGGFVGANLDYDQIARQFDFSGGQVGGYATYLNGGLFVDTLLNAHLLEVETRTVGFANELDATTLGLRTDAGYRFGSFRGGAFIEPLATIAVLWSDIEGFTNAGNRVSFDDEANVRGRLGLRVGTSYAAWGTTTVEPFVIGSLWSNLSGENQATLVSNGTTIRFEEDLDDVWGEVSLGVNFFNPSAGTAVFAKVDVTFGDEVEGLGGKAGMRVAW